jgi:hypothetical protein
MLVKSIAWILALILLPLVTHAQTPATQPSMAITARVVQAVDEKPANPANVTGTIGKPGDPKVAATLGHHGVLFIRTEARWKEFQDRLGEAMALKLDQPLPQFNFTKQNVVLVFADDHRQTEAFSLSKSDAVAKPLQLDFVLTWNNSPERGEETRSAKFILAVIPSSPSTAISVTSSPMLANRYHPVTELSATLGSKDGGDIADGLQAGITPKVATVKPGEDILIDFNLHLADLGKAKPEQFGTTPKAIFVWDDKGVEGYLNYAFFVTTPNGKTMLLRPKSRPWHVTPFPHPVEITAPHAYHLPGEVVDATAKSLKELGLDTTASGTYTITALYEESADTNTTPDGTKVLLWGGSIASNTITVEVKR